jgi:Mn-containing catalase
MFFTDDLHHDRPAVGGRTGRDHSQGLHRQPRPGRGGRRDEPGPGHRLRRRATAGRQLRQAWSGKYIVASGNLFADFHANATAEMQGIMQATRLYNMTDDPGVREMLRFNIARDTMHQNMWLAALEELRADGLETLPVPAQHPFDERNLDHAYEFQNMSEHVQSAEGRWAAGLAPDGKGEFSWTPTSSPAPASRHLRSPTPCSTPPPLTTPRARPSSPARHRPPAA